MVLLPEPELPRTTISRVVSDPTITAAAYDPGPAGRRHRRSNREGRRASSDLPMLRRVAEAAGIPADVLGAALGFSGPASVTVAAGQPEEDSMRRRTFMAAAGFAVPAHMLASLDDALAVLPDPFAAPTADEVAAQLARARRLFDAGDLAPLIDRLPRLMSVAHANAEKAHDAAGYARLTLCYSLATEALNKLGTPASRIT